MKRIIALVLGLACLGTGCGGTDQSPLVSTPPTSLPATKEDATAFADSNLEAAVRRALDQPTAPLANDRLLSLTRLDASDQGIIHLRGIEQLANLAALDLAENRIRNVTALAALPRLVFLDLSGNRISDIGALAQLVQLQSLVLNGNAVDEVASLLQLGQLRELEILGNALSAAARDDLAALRERGVQIRVDELVLPQEDGDAGLQPIDPAQLRLAFASDRHDGEYGIFVMNGFGEDLIHLANGFGAAWSPDGSQLAFSDNGNIFIINAEGGDLIELTEDSHYDYGPAWFPDGTQIAFFSSRDNGLGFYSIDRGGGDLRRVIDLDSVSEDIMWFGGLPLWSPGGDQVLFSFYIDYGSGIFGSEIYAADADEAGLANFINLSDHADADWSPAWSPDGTQIAFQSNRDGDAEIYVVDAAGAFLANLSGNPANDFSPHWSPDGRSILFSSDRDGNMEIYVMDTDGGEPFNLTGHPGADSSPRWSPDGSKIAFNSDRDGNMEVYVIDADGGELFNLTGHFAQDFLISWAPR